MRSPQKIKYIIKLALAYTLYYSGLLWLIKSIKLRNSAVVLMYHRVLSEEEIACSFSYSGIIVSPETFRRHACFLSRYFNVIDNREFTRKIVHQEPFRSSSCLITFDDGWQDNYHHAYTILKEYKIPATIFIPVDYIESGNLFWQEALGHAINTVIENSPDTLPPSLGELDKIQSASRSASHRKELIMEHVRRLKDLPYTELEQIQREISAQIDDEQIPQCNDSYLDWEQIKEMTSHDISFASHACSHKILTRLSCEELKEELERSKDVIEKQTSNIVDTIAYPNGNCNKDVTELAFASGYKVGFTTRSGITNHMSAPLEICRINIKDTTTRNRPMFLATILGIF